MGSIQYDFLIKNYPQILSTLEIEISNSLNAGNSLCSFEMYQYIITNNGPLANQLFLAINKFKNPQMNPKSFIGAVASIMASQGKIKHVGSKKSPKTNKNEECWIK